MIAASLVAVLTASAAACPPVQVGAADKIPAALVKRTAANFEAAYSKACAAKYLKKPLIDARARDKRLFLHNAPDANVASIYLSSGRMLLEYPFVPIGGKASIPSVKELMEAIYCAAHGATAKEQEESGRCLPD